MSFEKVMKKHIIPFCLSLLFFPFIVLADSADPEPTLLVTVNGVGITDTEVQHFISKQAKPIPGEAAIQEMINVELLVQAAKNENMMADESLVLEIKRTTSGLIASHYLQQLLRSLEITEQDLEDRYKKEYQDGEQATEYNANHILLETEAEALDVIKQLDEGASFDELAKNLSTGPSGKDGGALGWFKQGDMVAAFSTATTQLSKGQHTKVPVKTQFGWHVILLNETRTTQPPEFDSVQQQLSRGIASDTIRNKVGALHKAATIEFVKQ